MLRIALLPAPNVVYNGTLSDYVLNELSTLLVNDGRLSVVDGHNLELLQKEMNFQLSGGVIDETAQAIGKKLGAQAVILELVDTNADFIFALIFDALI
jgi:hypothetical protein